jgi:hypothetical protein
MLQDFPFHFATSPDLVAGGFTVTAFLASVLVVLIQ